MGSVRFSALLPFIYFIPLECISDILIYAILVGIQIIGPIFTYI